MTIDAFVDWLFELVYDIFYFSGNPDGDMPAWRKPFWVIVILMSLVSWWIYRQPGVIEGTIVSLMSLVWLWLWIFR